MRAVAATLSRCDVAIVQHEYGIYGGVDGDEVIDLLAAVTVPTIVVFHTVPLVPTAHQREVLVSVGRLADCVVVMTEAARTRLLASYPIDRSKVVTIAHGASLPPFEAGAAAGEPARPAGPQLLTWGLLGPGKGIEHALEALRLLEDVHPRPRYTIAGVTHPKVFARDGDEYRHALIQRAWASGIAGAVTFDDTYRDLPALTRFVASASCVVLPYDSRDQVTSGVLVDAVAAGRPVIATAFPHAVELLSGGAGIVVPHEDPEALAEAMRLVLGDREVMAAMAASAARLAPSLSWTAVAASYVRQCERLALAVEPVAV